MQKKRIVPILNLMKLGDSEEYPIERLTSVQGAVSRKHLETDKFFSIVRDKKNKKITVKRIS